MSRGFLWLYATRRSWRAIAAVEEQYATLPLPPDRPSPLPTDRCTVSILQHEGVSYLTISAFFGISAAIALLSGGCHEYPDAAITTLTGMCGLLVSPGKLG